jgi:hypothetical protein
MASNQKSIDEKFRSVDYDPDIDLYRARAKERAAKAEGVESLAYLIFGTNLIAIWAYWLDPKKKFRHSIGKVSRPTRFKRFRTVRSAPREYFRKQTNRTSQTIVSSTPGQSGSNEYEAIADNRSGALSPQDELYGILRDTSFKTRRPDQSQGEMELYAPSLKAKSERYSYNGHTSHITFSIPGYTETTFYREVREYGILGPSIILSQDKNQQFFNDMSLEVGGLLNEALPGLVASCLPSARRYRTLYNLFELRDLVKLLRQATEFYKSVLSADISLKTGSDAYLSYRFGWESTYKSLRQLLDVVPKINREINRLIERTGKPTSFHSGYTLVDRISSIPEFATEVFPEDEIIDAGFAFEPHNLVKLRMTLNVNVDLPRLDLPRLRKQLLLRKFGVDLPSPAEVLDFIPWTWLIDYFGSGFEYLKIIEALNYDKSVVNWGLISANCKGKIKVDFSGKISVNDVVTTLPPTSVSTSSRIRQAERSALFEYRYRVRRSIAALTDLKVLSEGENLSTFQTSILAALAAQKSKHGK